MTCKLLNINYGDYIILEIHDNNIEVYEYYLRDEDKNSFKFVFGTADRFTQVQLTVLADKGYFD